MNASNKTNNKKKRRRKKKNLSSEFKVDNEKNTIDEIDGFGKHEDYCDNDTTQSCEQRVSNFGLTFLCLTFLVKKLYFGHLYFF